MSAAVPAAVAAVLSMPGAKASPVTQHRSPGTLTHSCYVSVEYEAVCDGSAEALRAVFDKAQADYPHCQIQITQQCGDGFAVVHLEMKVEYHETHTERGA